MSKSIIGQKFNKLTVICDSGDRAPSGDILWKCECECGEITKVKKYDLIKGKIKSCGCSMHIGKHNLCDTPEYEIWKDIKRRCYNKNRPQYKDWGGRGIKMCDEWVNDFLAFYNYLSSLPETREEFINRTNRRPVLDRIDNDKNYEPENLKWVTYEESAQNRRMCVLTDDIVRLILQEKKNGKGIRQIYNELLNKQIINCDFPPVEAAYYRLTWENIEI